MAEKTLYVCRPILNGRDLHAWAAAQGFRSALPADDFHVTIAFSKEKVDWSGLKEKRGNVRIRGGARSIEKLGDATVLRFSSKIFKGRWQELRDAGASWDYPDYKPHVTISYNGAPKDIDNIDPYDGPLLFGPERFDEVNEDVKDEIKEVKMATSSPNPNNIAVKFRGKGEREMPRPPNMDVSSTTSGPKGGKPKFPRGLKKKAKKLQGQGRISDKAMKKMTGEG